MNHVITEEKLDNLESYLADTSLNLQWSSVFVLPPWLHTWWRVFGAETEMMLWVLRRNENITGIASLMRKKETAYFLGSTDVCDYMDFIVVPGLETEFFSELLDNLKNSGIKKLDLAHVRPDSAVLKFLKPLADSKGYKAMVTTEEISLETDLPPDWDKYLESLTGKQRHEVRRKLRRLEEAGQVDYHFTEDNESVSGYMDTFLGMFTESRQDKADFLTEKMEQFFRLLAQNMLEAGLLRFGFLRLDNKPIACIMCFDYNDCIYLYNSGYDPEYNYLSAGLLSKVLGIKDSIEKGKKRFDFLKGSEPYKYHLGGREVVLSRCLIDLE